MDIDLSTQTSQPQTSQPQTSQPQTGSAFKLRRSERDPTLARCKALEATKAEDERRDPNWSGWASGETELGNAQKSGKWPDGQKIGRGHGQPYLQPIYAHAMRAKLKTVEGRPGVGWASSVTANDWITFKIPASGGKKLIVRATRVRRYPTFEAMLRECGIEACLPGLKGGIKEGIRVYRSFGTFSGSTYADLERESGAIAIDVEPLRSA
jgi:ASC-1-like (ASCH) protein